MTDNKLADALRDIQQYLQMTAPSPDCGHLLQITVDALAEHDAPDECFCDSTKLGAPGVSCGDCPTRDYGAQPAPAPVQVDGAGELPPLPAAEYRVSPDSRRPSLYDEDAMRAYARAALAAHDAEKAEPDGDYVLVPEVTDEDIEAACRAYCGDMNPDTITNYSGVPVWKLYETECRAVIESYRARRLLASAEQGAK